MELLSRNARSVRVQITHDEMETLFDALDALNSQLERFRDDPEPDEGDVGGAKIEADIAKVEKLFDAFEPIIKETRRRRHRSCQEALANIAETLDGKEWNATTMDEIATILRETGFHVREP
jgi:hypothetical protein